jgi:decaprenyl-phosphate phosphoribosyltransferase
MRMPEAETTLPRANVEQAVAAPMPEAPARLPLTRERRRGPLRAALVTMRPRQWVKNLLVIAAAGAAGALGHDDVPVRVGLAFVAFCLLASGIYAINDVRDAEEDRRHPRKRFRPVAAWELDPRAATVLGIGLMATGLALCAAIRPLLAVVGAGYLTLTLSYTMVWRHLLLLDIVAIAGGFVLRAVAGGVAPPVTLSRAFVLVVTFAAVFVAAGKRHSELQRIDLAGYPGPAPPPVGPGAKPVRRGVSPAGAQPATGRRKVLEGYTRFRLRLILLVSAAGALIAYAVWAFELPSVHGVPWRPLTIIPVAACLVRYGMLIRSGSGESPEDLLLGDRILQVAGAAWLVLFALSVHAAG